MADRRAAPHILRLGGLSHGSGQFLGQLVHNKTTELRELQDIENLKKFADGEPETFLEYWKERQKTAKGKLKNELAALAARAQKRVKTNEEDAAALASYARTNNHQEYLNHLLKRLDEETDPNRISKLGTQINELRSRVFSSSGSGSGAIGGGVSQDQFVSARDKWGETRMKYEAIVKGRPLTAMEYGDLKSAAKDYETTLKRIIFSSDATTSRKNEMNTAYLLESGPNLEFLEKVSAKSDARLLKDIKNDVDFATALAPLIAAKNYGKIALLYAERQRDLTVAAPQALGVDGASAIGQWHKDADAKIMEWTTKATQESKKFAPSQQQKLDSEYSIYWSDMQEDYEADQANPPSNREPAPAPKAKEVWMRQLEHAQSADQFSKDVNRAYSNETFTALQALVTGGITYDPVKGYQGDSDQVENAKNSDKAIKIGINTPGSDLAIYKQAGLDDAVSVRMIREGTLTPDVAMLIMQGGGPNAHAAPIEGSPEATAYPEPTEDQAPTAALGGSPDEAVAHGAQERADMAAPANMGKGGLQSMLTNPKPDDYDSLIAGIDTFLTEYEYGELPAFTPPKEKPVADYEALFPFAGEPPQVEQPVMAPPQPKAGQRPGSPF